MATALCVLWAPPLVAEVFDVTAADVTTRAFSVVWASDEPVTSATVRVYDDDVGTTELTGSLSIATAVQAPSLALGLVKVDVSGLAANSCYYFQTETTGASGTVSSPAAPPFVEVCTAVQSRRANALDQPILNDLIGHDVFGPDGVTPATAALLVLEAPALGAYPLSAIVGDGFAAPAAVADLNNLFDAATGATAEVPADEVLQLTELRGLYCPALQDHRLVRYRRAPAHEEVAEVGEALTELETGNACFFADVLCDDTIDIMDAQRVLNAFDSSTGDCAFNPDLDIVADQAINILDVQSVLNRFGESAPFAP